MTKEQDGTGGSSTPPGGTGASGAKKKDLRTPHAWARAKGHHTAANPAIPERRLSFYSAEFEAANVIYGWSRHAFDFQAPGTEFLIEEKCFDEAMKAAAQFPTVKPHEPALTPKAKERFKDFKPALGKQDKEKAEKAAKENR